MLVSLRLSMMKCMDAIRKYAVALENVKGFAC